MSNVLGLDGKPKKPTPDKCHMRLCLVGTDAELYIHQSLKPLAEVDLRTDEDFGQMTFLGECDGMCGV